MARNLFQKKLGLSGERDTMTGNVRPLRLSSTPGETIVTNGVPEGTACLRDPKKKSPGFHCFTRLAMPSLSYTV